MCGGEGCVGGRVHVCVCVCGCGCGFHLPLPLPTFYSHSRSSYFFILHSILTHVHHTSSWFSQECEWMCVCVCVCVRVCVCVCEGARACMDMHVWEGV